MKKSLVVFTLLFIACYLFGAFVSDVWNIRQWHPIAKIIIVVFSFFVTVLDHDTREKK